MERYKLQLLTLGILLFSTLVKSEHTLGTCDLELHQDEVAWQHNLTDTVVDIVWGYGKENCNSQASCFGFNDTSQVPIDVQLTPMDVQQGVKIRFVPHKMGDTTCSVFSMQPYRVTQEGFGECDTERGQAIITVATTEPFIVEDQYLQPGSNFFIVNTPNPLFKCSYGLRVNITVKPNDCHYPTETPVGMFCLDHGHCVTTKSQNTYNCHCCDPYTGHHCQELNGCLSHNCQNGATCVDVAEGYDGQSYQCVCPEGRSGVLCEVDTNECHSDPCQNGGVCVDMNNGYQCYCIPGFTGTHCEKDYNECSSHPCQHGGTCIDELNHYICKCGKGYKGQHCEIKIDLCKPHPCNNSTKCVDEGNTFKCVCPVGYTGSHCEININECNSHPCHNGGTCQDLANGYKCYCPSGRYSGRHCENNNEEMQFHEPQSSDPESDNWRFYVIIGCLAGALLFAVCLMVICICTLHSRSEPNKVGHLDPLGEMKSTGYTYDVSSVSRQRPSVQAIYEATSFDYRTNPDEPLISSLKPRKV
ncbi:uncharacterized protein [Amphiura filiformis]|uniref:uncharacterized protein n=1 Tax=Amphiura filiformis TaxID=82378 RepID=UPI003B223524